MHWEPLKNRRNICNYIQPWTWTGLQRVTITPAWHEIGSFPSVTLYKQGPFQTQEFCHPLKRTWWCWWLVVCLINSVKFCSSIPGYFYSDSKKERERDWEEESVKILSAVRTEDLDWTVNTSWTVPGGPTVGINNTPQSTVHTLPIHGELFNKIWMFKFDFVTAFGQQRKCPMKRRMAHSCHNRWHLDWQFFGWKINETDCHFTSWKENSF